MKLKLSAIVIIFQLAFLANAQPFQAYRLKASTVFKNNIFKDGPDSLAQFQGPARMVSIGDSVLFLADMDNNRIRRISISTKRTTTIAGDGRARRLDSIGVLASLHRPKDLVLIGDSVLYITEEGSHSIRKMVLASGRITTIAGGSSGFANGLGLSARFNTPMGIINRGDSILFVADSENNRIRKIDLKNGNSVTTFAGTGRDVYINKDSLLKDSINIGKPRGVAISGNNLVVVENDYNHPVIRYIRFSNNIVYNVGGQDRPQEVIALDGDTILITCDGGGPSILEKVLSNPAYSRNLFATQADGLLKIGNTVYYSQPQNAQIFSMSYRPTTTPSRFVGLGRSTDGGTSRARFGQLGGFAFKNGWIYYNDITTGRIRKYNTSTGITQTVTRGGRGDNGNGKASLAAAKFGDIAEMKFGPDGKLYIADGGNTQIRVLDEVLDSVFLVSGNRNSGYVNGTLAQARYSNLSSIAYHNAKWYIAESGNAARIRVIDPAANTVSTLAGPGEGTTGNGLIDSVGSAVRFSFNIGSLVPKGDTLYIMDKSNRRMRGIVLSTGRVFTAAGNDSYDNLPYAFLDKTGSLLMRFNGFHHSFIRVASKNGPWPVVLGAQQTGDVDGIGTVSRFNNPSSTVLDPVTGDLYIADRNNQSFRKIEYILFNQAPIVTGPTPASFTVTSTTPVSVPNFLNISAGPAWESSQTVSVYSVSSSNNAIFSVQPTIGADGTLSFTASGTNGNSTIRVCVRDNGGLDNNGLDSACYTFTIIANITSNKERLAKSSLSIFPNPTENGQFFFSSSDDEKLLEIEILDLSGKRLEKKSLLSFNGNIKVKSKGVFLAKFKYSDGYIETRKLESK